MSSFQDTAPAIPSPFHVVIVGAGLCGLAAAISTLLAGHRVTIVEAVSELKEVGAGLQLTPNGTRLLKSWGIADRLADSAIALKEFNYYRYDGRVLAHRDNYDLEILNRYGSPTWCLHRADLQRAMVQRAVELGANLLLDSKVAQVELEESAVILEKGAVIKGDLVLAADGLWSSLRSIFAGYSISPKPTGDLAYRIILDASTIEDLELQEWIARKGLHIWVGPGVHAVAYGVRDGQMLNLVLLIPDDLPRDVAKIEGNVNEMKKLFEGWDPTGDACHAMLPYMAQGANSSLEDGATLGALLAHVSSKQQIPRAIDMFDAIRRPRLDQLVRETFLQGHEHHLPDGEEQVARDLHLAESFKPYDLNAPVEECWTHPKIQSWIYSYNVYETVEKTFEENPFLK